MTALRPAAQRRGRAPGDRVVPLRDADVPSVWRLVDEEPYAAAAVAARLEATRGVGAAALGGELFGVRGAAGVECAVFHGGNLVPIGDAAQVWPLLGRYLAERPRRCSSVVGSQGSVSRLWPVLERAWGPARLIRTCQPVLVSTRPAAVAPDPAVLPVGIEALEAYLPAAAAMFTEELGIAPFANDDPRGALAYRRRVARLIGEGHALARLDAEGQVVFKAEFGAVTGRTAQVQGVWVRPELRGRGIGSAAMAAVIDHGLRLAPTVSLYVNDFNATARRMYARLGMRQVATMATVLL